jgi:dGTPase
MMEWSKLLTRQRLGKDKPEDPQSESGRTCFQRDYDRLVFSSPFRRLKDKTQVFSLSKNDYVRTRLIHSLEVSCVGRSLGTLVGREIINRHNLAEDFSASDFGDIVSAACLAHDIGNPPFGHAGEDAIGAAFRSWYNQLKKQILSERQKADFEKFEGNAQGFRTIARLEMYRNQGGMQLTCPTLATFMKYPRESHISKDILEDYKRNRLSNEIKSIAKYGFFQSEKELFTQVAETVGLAKRNDDLAWWARHPLAFLVEAADDICYYIVDLEDGHRMNYIPYAEASELLEQIVKPNNPKSPNESNEERIKYLRAKAIGSLINQVAELFLDHEQDLLAGKFDRDSISQSEHFGILKEMVDLTKEKVYFRREIVGIQIAGHEVLGDLFFQFANAVQNDDSTGKSELLLNMLPKEYRPDAGDSCYDKLLKVTDYISGMTDSYATTLFQQLKGISLI